jgi:hypothetical protein
MRARPRTLVAVLLVLGLSTSAMAQTTGAISGYVRDQSRAVLPGVSVTATQALTNVTSTAITNADGAYSFPQLSLGVYDVRAELSGFRAVNRSGIEVTLNRNASVDFSLEVGQVTEQVTVTGDAPLVDATSNQMGTNIDARRIAGLPTLDRNPMRLVSLVPGAQQVLQADNVQGFQSNRVAFNGARPELSNWLLDGGDNTSTLRNYGNPSPNPDAIQEFKVLSNNYSAEFGRSVGAIVNVVTKSGTNAFHGTAFEFFRDDRLNRENFMTGSKPTYSRHQAGGTLGGPIRRDRTFFFGTYQGVREERERIGAQAVVPTAAQRQGVFPGLVRDPLLTGNCNPADRTACFPNNTIPANRIVKPATEFLNRVVPLPNFGADRYQATFLENAPENQYLAKVDHVLSKRHKLAVSYFKYDSSLVEFTTTAIPYALRDTATTQYNVNIHEYWTVGSSLVNHFKLNYTRSEGTRDISTAGDFTANDIGVNYGPLADLRIGPAIAVTGFFNGTLGGSAGGPKFSNNYMAGDTVNWLKGRHSIKAGGEVWLRRLFDFTQGGDNGGQFTFTGVAAAASQTAGGAAVNNPMADFLLGRVQAFAFRAQTYKSNNQWAFYGFVQDDFRVNGRLTLNLGLRYELDRYPTHPGGLIAVYVPGRRSACVPTAPAGELFVFCDADGLPSGGYKNDVNNFQPRIGFAYNVFGNGKTVVRGGYGLTNAFAIFNTLQEGQVALPFAVRQSVTSNAGAISFVDPFASVPGGNPFPYTFSPESVRPFPSSAEYALATLDMPTGSVHQFNLSVQRQFGEHVVAEVAYVGNRGYDLAGQYNINTPRREADGTLTPRPLGTVPFTNLLVFRGDVRSWYDALQTRVEKRFSDGFSLLGSYTFGKAEDYVSFHSNQNWIDPMRPELNKGRADYDRRHVGSVAFVWTVPFLQQRKGALGAILGGWTVSGIGQFLSGEPVDILQGGDPNGDTLNNDRPSLSGDWKRPRSSDDAIRAAAGPSATADQIAAGLWFNTAALSRLAAGQPSGNFGRNIIGGPRFKNVDVSLAKTIRLFGQHALEVRVESFNLFDFVNFGAPNNNPANALYGRVTSAGAGRSFQLGAKYSF